MSNALLTTDWFPQDLPPGTAARPVALRTADFAATGGTLYQMGRSDTVVCIMHPREFMACHYLIPDIVGAGVAAWSQSPRSVGNDMRLEHEVALQDVAAGLRFLREAGFTRIVLCGNSGGSGLFALYAQQSALPPADRILRTPGGRPTGLDTLDMPAIHGMILLAPHPGQGALLLGCIDPSVVDEDDPLSVDPALDPFDPAHGYAPHPAPTRYDPAFVTRFRAAQRNRVERLDAQARTLIHTRMEARRAVKAGTGGPAAQRIAAHTPIMTVWRTDADLRCFDLTLDPSDRAYGSLWGRDPFASNYGAVGFARVCTPESWLSTWSGLSSHALLARTAPAITQPTLLIEYTGDQCCFPSVIEEIAAALGSTALQRERVRGDHHGRALHRDEEPGRAVAGRLVAAWLHGP